jgi:chemotaxis protein CheC
LVLTDRQNDALAELINIAFSRTGAALSELTGQRVLLSPPSVSVHRTTDLPIALARYIPGEVASIHQVFAGPVAGDALLLLNYEGAMELTNLLIEEPIPDFLDESAREVLTEVGNILLNACLGMFGNLLQVHVSFSVPRLHLESLDDLVASLLTGEDDRRYALVVSTAFKVRDSAVSGFLVMALSVASLDRLLHEIEEWEGRQH